MMGLLQVKKRLKIGTQTGTQTGTITGTITGTRTQIDLKKSPGISRSSKASYPRDLFIRDSSEYFFFFELV